jgi:chaperonin GroES
VEVKEGDIVLYKEYGGTEVTIEGEKYMLLDSDDVLGIML